MTGIVAHTYPEWWLKLAGQVAHWSTDYSEIRMINEKLDFYVMEVSDEEFDPEEVRKLVKRLDELDPIPLPWKSDEEALKDFWDYCEERQREERIIAEMKIKG